MAKNRVIGANNGIPWHLPDDLRLFKQLTMGHHIIMGRKTYESIGRLLPDRTSVIITRQPDYFVAGAIMAHSLDEAIAAAADNAEVFVIGGAEIFREALPIADRLHLSLVDGEPEGNIFMPPFEQLGWREMLREQRAGYEYMALERASSESRAT